MIASARDLLKSTHIHLEPPSPRRGLFVVPVLVHALGGIDQFELENGYPAELEQRIRQMRDPDEMISWDDPDDVQWPFASRFRMPDIERYTGVGCPRIHLRLYSTVMKALETSCWRTWEDLAQEFLRQYSFSGDTSVTRRELEFLRQGSDEPISSFISCWREKTVEMIERPTERYHMSMFLRSLHPRFARHLTGVPFQDFRSLVQALLDVDDGISRGLCIDDLVIIPMRDHCRYPGVISRLYSIIILIQFSSTLLCILILSRCDLHFSFSVHRLVSHDMSSLVPIGDVRDLFRFGMPLDRAFERLIATGFLAPLALGHPEYLTSTFSCSRVLCISPDDSHRTDYCVSTLVHTCSSSSFGLIPSRLDTQGTDIHRHFDIADLVEHIEIRLLQLRVSIVIERSSRSSDAFIATFDFIDICYFGYLTSTTSPTFSVPTAFLIHFIGYVDTTSIRLRALQLLQFLRSDFTLVDDVGDTFQI
ncbi:hypothetical protein CK203_047234 [Vitis vinifera]|uniref:Retrotransposon gag domain-containing protein n=1 Tax=Vitis vinifera TaxID=29760 RepID=A0A438HZ36_VITVI|nr:hypothetical protein CK203_047234 [Vitis vinifera]